MKNKKKWKRLLQAKNKSLHSSVTSSLVSFHWLSLTCFFLIHKLHSTPPSHLLRKRYILSLKKKLNTTSWLFVHTLVTLVIQECISFLVSWTLRNTASPPFSLISCCLVVSMFFWRMIWSLFHLILVPFQSQFRFHFTSLLLFLLNFILFAKIILKREVSRFIWKVIRSSFLCFPVKSSWWGSRFSWKKEKTNYH